MTQKLLPIKDYRGFTITGTQYIEPQHPQYNYLGFRAENDIGQSIEATFHDIDIRCKTYNELLDIFLKRVDGFINEINKEMTQEDKKLLLKDLSTRLPYGVIVQYKGHNKIPKNKTLTGSDLDCNMKYYKPYLRPMSSMTEEEREEFSSINSEEKLNNWVLNFLKWY